MIPGEKAALEQTLIISFLTLEDRTTATGNKKRYQLELGSSGSSDFNYFIGESAQLNYKLKRKSLGRNYIVVPKLCVRKLRRPDKCNRWILRLMTFWCAILTLVKWINVLDNVVNVNDVDKNTHYQSISCFVWLRDWYMNFAVYTIQKNVKGSLIFFGKVIYELYLDRQKIRRMTNLHPIQIQGHLFLWKISPDGLSINRSALIYAVSFGWQIAKKYLISREAVLFKLIIWRNDEAIHR